MGHTELDIYLSVPRRPRWVSPRLIWHFARVRSIVNAQTSIQRSDQIAIRSLLQGQSGLCDRHPTEIERDRPLPKSATSANPATGNGYDFDNVDPCTQVRIRHTRGLPSNI